MREIKFRGKTNQGNWIYGDLIHSLNNKVYIRNKDIFDEVLPETVGQFIGIKDVEGKEIYEEDIVQKTSIEYDYKGNEHKTEWLGVVKYITPKFIYKGVDSFYLAGTRPFKVIGNIYDNPELLEEVKDD